MRKELPSPRSMLCVYVDESGNTGDAALMSSLSGSQPSFALVGVGEVDGSSDLERVWSTLRHNLGIATKELKGRAMDRRPDLILGLVQALGSAGIPLFAEVMDKAFYVATNIVSYVLGISRMPSSTPDLRAIANAFTATITEDLGASAIAAYSNFATAPNRHTFDTYISAFRAELGRARAQSLHSTQAMVLSAIEEIFEDEVSKVGCSSTGGDAYYGLLLPPPDELDGGKRLAMLPHVPAFTNLCARVNCFAPDEQRIRIVHDQQPQVGQVLDDYAGILSANAFAEELMEMPQIGVARWLFAPERFSLSFQDSKDSSGIQIADMLARYLARRLNAVIKNEAAANDSVLPVLASLSDPDIGLGVNIVSTTRRAECFWGDAMRGLVFR